MSTTTPLSVATECAREACLALWAIPDYAAAADRAEFDYRRAYQAAYRTAGGRHRAKHAAAEAATTQLRAARDAARDALAEAKRRHRELAAQLTEIQAGDIA